MPPLDDKFLKQTPAFGNPPIRLPGTPEKPTVEMDKVPAWAVKLTEKVDAVARSQDVARQDAEVFRTDICDHLHKLDVTAERLEQAHSVHRQSMMTVTDGLSDLTTRVSSQSLKVRGESSTNLNQDAAIASIISEQAAAKDRDAAAQAALAANTELTAKGLTLAQGAAKNPAVLALLLAILTYATSWLGHHTP